MSQGHSFNALGVLKVIQLFFSFCFSTFQNSSNFVSWEEIFNQPTTYRYYQNDNILRGMMVQPTAEVEKFSSGNLNVRCQCLPEGYSIGDKDKALLV